MIFSFFLFFYFFIINNFEIPILTIPMRKDKITNGKAILFIFPDSTKLNH